MHRSPRQVARRGRSLAVVAAASLSATLLWAAPAGAHISPQDPEATAGGYFTTAFKVGHGCEGSPTTRIEIKMADGVTSVKPQPVAGWNLSTTMRTLDPPVDNHGTPITETVDTVVWEGGSLPDSELQMFWVSMKLPEGDAGDTLAFPVVQTCEAGQTDWIEPIVEGEDEPEHPAPVITLTAAGEDAHGDAGDATTGSANPDDGSSSDASDADDGGEEAAAVTDVEDSNSNSLAIVALVLGALGLVLGGVALVRSGRRA
ncbi:MAG: YcnI family copper-binding membrane protein [Microthrixaceae bacterium]